MITFIINNMIEFKDAMAYIYECNVDVQVIRWPGGMVKSIIVSRRKDDTKDDYGLLEAGLEWTSETGWYNVSNVCPSCVAKGESTCGHLTLARNKNQKLYWVKEV